MEISISGKSLMIGSMPHGNAMEAFAVLDEFPLHIPTWPQLPARSFLEGMIPQCSEGFSGVKIDEDNKSIRIDRGSDMIEQLIAGYEAILAEDIEYFKISSRFAQGLHEFVERSRKEKTLPVVKGQITGPFTFGLGLNDPDGRAIWWDENYRELIYGGLGLKALWQVRMLREIAGRVLMFCDEPILSVLGTPAYMGVKDEDVVEGINRVISPLKEAGALAGMHCCGNMDWGLMAGTDLDILALDAYEFGHKTVLYADEISAFLERGGYLAWGIVPTGNPEAVAGETVDTLRERLDRIIDLLTVSGVDEDLLRSRALYTPSCGVGSLPEDSARRVMELLAGLAPGH